MSPGAVCPAFLKAIRFCNAIPGIFSIEPVDSVTSPSPIYPSTLDSGRRSLIR